MCVRILSMQEKSKHKKIWRQNTHKHSLSRTAFMFTDLFIIPFEMSYETKIKTDKKSNETSNAKYAGEQKTSKCISRYCELILSVGVGG